VLDSLRIPYCSFLRTDNETFDMIALYSKKLKLHRLDQIAERFDFLAQIIGSQKLLNRLSLRIYALLTSLDALFVIWVPIAIFVLCMLARCKKYF